MLIQIHIKPILSFEQLFDTRESYVETPFFLFFWINRKKNIEDIHEPNDRFHVFLRCLIKNRNSVNKTSCGNSCYR